MKLNHLLFIMFGFSSPLHSSQNHLTSQDWEKIDLAFETNDNNILEKYINNLKDVNIPNSRLLIQAAYHDNYKIVKLLLDKNADTSLTLHTVSPLMITNSAQIAEILLKHGASLDYRESDNQYNALEYSLSSLIDNKENQTKRLQLIKKIRFLINKYNYKHPELALNEMLYKILDPQSKDSKSYKRNIQKLYGYLFKDKIKRLKSMRQL